MSRLHDEKGHLVNFVNIFRNGPRALTSGIGRIMFDYRPQLPWISYNAISFFDHFLTKDKTILEFGSGMSTVWYAKRSKEVYSVEDYEPWYQKVCSTLEVCKQKNVVYKFKRGTNYSSYMADQGKLFDMIMIDGSDRSACAANAVKLVKHKGGVIYLDNSDKHSSLAGGDTRLAEAILLKFAKEKGASVQYFTDFCPCEFFVQEGMLVQLP